MKNLKMRLILLTVISLTLTSCFNPVGSIIYKPDFKLKECRVFKVIQSDPEILVQKDHVGPIEECHDIWGVQTPTFGKIVKEWNAWKKQKEAQ